MALPDLANQEVLLGYGQFLESLNSHCYSIKFALKSGSFRCFEDSLGIQIGYPDHSSVSEKIDVDNSPQNKILVVFAAICKEIRDLNIELMTEYAFPIAHYGESGLDKVDRQKVLSNVCKFLPVLYDVLNFLSRCRQTLNHLLQQLVCYYEFQRNPNNIFPSLASLAVFSSLSTLLKTFMIIDVLLEGNNDYPIKDHLLMLQKQINASEFDKSQTEEVEPLLSVTLEILNNLFSTSTFQATLQTHIEGRNSLSSCDEFKKQLNLYLKKRSYLIESTENDMDSQMALSDILITYVFAVNVFGISDKKLHKSITEMCKKQIVCSLCHDVMWIPSSFLVKHLESKESLGKQLSDPSSLLVNHQMLFRCLEQAEFNLLRDVKPFTFQVYKWSLQMSNVLSSDSICVKLNDVDSANLCFEGLQLCKEMKLLMNSITYLHSILCKPMTKAVAVALCKMTELTKAVESIFESHHLDIGKRINHILQRFLIQSLTIVTRAKKWTNKDEKSKAHKDDYSALELIEKLLYGGFIEDNMLLMQLAISFISLESPLGSDGSHMLGKLLSNLQTITLLNKHLAIATNCNFILKEPHILPIYFKHIVGSGMNLFTFQLLLNNLRLHSPFNHLLDETGTLRYSKEAFKTMVLPEFCHRIETYLRLQAHSHLQEGEYIPVGRSDFREVLRAPTLIIDNNYFNIHGLVENYLDKIFYDLASVALHDWQTYREIRSLAECELKLTTVEDYLPSQTMLQGLDILEIMRNIHIFVSRYLYNMNNQCFIESNSNNKHLNTIKINQIANSIWTHGTGVMNTTTNFVYQYLKKKIVQFSQFLFDENISSRLLKDKSHFDSLKNDHQPLFPYDRALKFNKIASRLTTGDGITYLDQCRILVTHIGNALGYVRMVRSGGLHHCLETSSYLSLINHVYLSKETLREAGCDSVNCLTKFVSTLLHNITEGSEYLKILSEVFSSVFDKPDNNHLKLLPFILPALIINYINHIVTEKEKVTKRNKHGKIFSDDGFAIGITYLLSIFNLHDEFESLHWFDSVTQKYNEEQLVIESQLATQSSEMKNGDNTLKLSIRRLKLYKKEYEVLFYNLNSAKIFFS